MTSSSHITNIFSHNVYLMNVTMVDGQMMFLNAKVCDDLSNNKNSVST